MSVGEELQPFTEDLFDINGIFAFYREVGEFTLSLIDTDKVFGGITEYWKDENTFIEFFKWKGKDLEDLDGLYHRCGKLDIPKESIVSETVGYVFRIHPANMDERVQVDLYSLKSGLIGFTHQNIVPGQPIKKMIEVFQHIYKRRHTWKD